MEFIILIEIIACFIFIELDLSRLEKKIDKLLDEKKD